MKKKYWVDDDGYIIYGNDDNQVIVCEMYPEHVQELTKIIESHADLLDACKDLVAQYKMRKNIDDHERAAVGFGEEAIAKAE